MVKLRGVNIWPEALGEIATAHPKASEDYFVRAIREGNRDEMLISVVSPAPAREFPTIQQELEVMLKDALGLRVKAEVVEPGALDALTEINTSPKLKRFRDDRK